MRVLVTGSRGFIGKHLMEALQHRGDIQVTGFDVPDSPQILEQALTQADCIFHLAGVNRPQTPAEFQTGNADVTSDLCRSLANAQRKPLIVFTSSIQAVLDNPYGASKKAAEGILQGFAHDSGAHVVIFRLANVFGKGAGPITIPSRPPFATTSPTTCLSPFPIR